VPPDVALKRLLRSRRQIKPTEAGADVFPGLSPEEGFLKYQSAILEVYDKVSQEENNFVVIDGTKDPREVQNEIRRKVVEVWEGGR
jgi:dTMP kinase